MHREAHGLAAARIIEVTPDIAEAFMGAAEIDEGGAALLPDRNERDPGRRTVLFTDIVESRLRWVLIPGYHRTIVLRVPSVALQ